MNNKTQRTRYSLRSQLMHALVAFMVIGLMLVGVFLEDFPSSIQGNMYMLHKSFGLVVLVLMFLRISFILFDGRPRLPENTPLYERVLSKSVQYALYVLLIAMPLSGWIMSVAGGYIPVLFDIWTLDLPFVPKSQVIAEQYEALHYYFAWGILALLILHVLGNIKHYFYNKDKVVQTMWNFKK